MSLVTDSPVNSSSSDDFAAFLDDELDSGSSNSSLEDENDNDNDLESERFYLNCLSFLCLSFWIQIKGLFWYFS